MKHYVNNIKLEKARAVVKLHGSKPHKSETENKVWGEAAKPAEVRLYDRLISENPDFLKKEEELVDEIYKGLGGVIEIYKDEKHKEAVRAARSKAMTSRFA